jgi:hypothetical protein
MNSFIEEAETPATAPTGPNESATEAEAETVPDTVAIHKDKSMVRASMDREHETAEKAMAQAKSAELAKQGKFSKMSAAMGKMNAKMDKLNSGFKSSMRRAAKAPYTWKHNYQRRQIEQDYQAAKRDAREQETITREEEDVRKAENDVAEDETNAINVSKLEVAKAKLGVRKLKLITTQQSKAATDVDDGGGDDAVKQQPASKKSKSKGAKAAMDAALMPLRSMADLSRSVSKRIFNKAEQAESATAGPKLGAAVVQERLEENETRKELAESSEADKLHKEEIGQETRDAERLKSDEDTAEVRREDPNNGPSEVSKMRQGVQAFRKMMQDMVAKIKMLAAKIGMKFKKKKKSKNPLMQKSLSSMDKVKKKMMPHIQRLNEYIQKYMLEDEFPPEPLMAPPDIPAFGGVGSKPSIGAKASASVAAEKAAEAGVFATYSARAAEAADANAASAAEADADALAAKLGAVNESYTHSMALSLNRYAKLVGLAARDGQTASLPREILNAREIARDVDEMVKTTQEQLKRIQEFEADEERLAEIHEQPVLDTVSQIRDRMKEQLPSLLEMQGYAREHKDVVIKMWPNAIGEPPDIAKVLLRPDGATPWWPDKAPPMELPPPMIMLKPKAGCSLSPTFL